MSEAMINLALDLVKGELRNATEKFGTFASPHEGIAVIEEEFLELRKAVFWGEGNPTDEAIQVAAMAIRFLVDLSFADPAAPPQEGESDG